MTKNEYIRALRRRLRFRMKGAELSEVLSDIAECFEAGASEGRSDDEISASLGSPESAAAALAPAEDGVPAFFASLAELLPPVAAAAAALCFIALCCGSPLAYALPLLPPAVWLLLERKGFIGSLRGRCDLPMLIGAALIFGAGLSAQGLLSALYIDGRRDILLSVMTAGLACGAMAAMLISMVKNGKKGLTFLPAAGFAAAVYCFIDSFDFFGARSVDYGTTSYEAAFLRRMEHMGRYCGNYLRLVIALAAAVLLWSIIGRNALTMISLALSSGICLQALTAYLFLARLDPMDAVFDGRALLGDGTPAAAGLIAAAISLGITLAARRNTKNG